MAKLFGKNKLRQIAEQVNTESIIGYVDVVRKWQKDYHTGSLKADKETSREQQYNRDFFLDILGYEEKPASPYSFVPKDTSDLGQLPDALISYTDDTQSIRNIAAVVELKGASIDLDRPQRRDGNLSPVQQGFKYKSQYRSVPFVIVSNFWEFRLYHDNLLDYEIWTLDDLVNPEDDYLLFKTWYVLLTKSNFTTPKGSSKTEGILSDIRIEQENISKKFYKVYRDARLELLRDIYRRNSTVREDIDLGIEKAQKVIDRIVFAAFAEDSGLLPDNTLQSVITSADNSTFGGTLWNELKSFFGAIDKGSNKLEIPDGYNGGLFHYDPDLDTLEIDDVPLRKVVELGTYNFAEDLSVNILGHIFEQSISDLEEIKDKVNESNSLEAIGQSRRKKDGIFYTPDYIVRYIVDNSLGLYLREHEAKFKSEFGLKGDIMDKTYEKREKQAYAKYQDFLQNIKVVDPACGSGAFLVYVFDYLLAENKRVGDILGNTLFSTDTWVRDILRNNIYGVDLNEESVEITKLSLWLKTAQKGKKLTTLDANIKTGNSLLIDWRDAFPEVFKNGGFDVVVMNPPYVKEAAGKQIFTELHNNPMYQGKMDLWYFFGGLALDITKQDKGIIGFIAPNNWITNDGAGKFRNRVLKDAQIERFVDFNDYKVFDQAGIQTMIAVMRNSNKLAKYTLDYSKVTTKALELEGVKDFLNKIDDSRFVYFESEIERSKLADKPLSFANSYDKKLLSKIVDQATIYLEASEIHSGIDIGQDYVNKKSQAKLGAEFKVGDGVFNLSQNEYNSLGLSENEKAIIEPFYTTKQVNRYFANPRNTTWVIYTESQFKNPDNIAPYPNIKSHLDKYQSILTSANKPYGLHRSRERKIFEGEKILSIRKCAKPSFAFVDFDSYVNRTYNIIKTDRVNMRYLTAILNSKLVAYWLLKRGKLQGGLYQIDVSPLMSIPIRIADNQEEIAALADKMSLLNEQSYEMNNNFQRLLKSELGLAKWSAKWNRWYELPFEEFISTINSAFTFQQKDELLPVFDKYKIQLLKLDNEISRTETEINKRVYDLYNLSHQEVAAVEAG